MWFDIILPFEKVKVMQLFTVAISSVATIAQLYSLYNLVTRLQFMMITVEV